MTRLPPRTGTRGRRPDGPREGAAGRGSGQGHHTQHAPHKVLCGIVFPTPTCHSPTLPSAAWAWRLAVRRLGKATCHRRRSRTCVLPTPIRSFSYPTLGGMGLAIDWCGRMGIHEQREVRAGYPHALHVPSDYVSVGLCLRMPGWAWVSTSRLGPLSSVATWGGDRYSKGDIDPTPIPIWLMVATAFALRH